MDSVNSQEIATLAQRFGVSQSAVETLAKAVQRGHGTMAQFDHPELGGMGQWTRGGMTMIGDMFNDGLKAKVKEICSELASMPRSPQTEPTHSTDNWWGEDLGRMGAGGSQNEIRYAYFQTRAAWLFDVTITSPFTTRANIKLMAFRSSKVAVTR
jgi:hypothetical protein